MASEQEKQQQRLSAYSALAEVHRMHTRLLEEFNKRPNEYRDLHDIPGRKWDELFRYLVLIRKQGDETFSPTVEVDNLWRQMILNVNLNNAVCGGNMIAYYTGRTKQLGPFEQCYRSRNAQEAMKKLFYTGTKYEQDENQDKDDEERIEQEEDEEDQEEKHRGEKDDSSKRGRKRHRTNRIDWSSSNNDESRGGCYCDGGGCEGCCGNEEDQDSFCGL